MPLSRPHGRPIWLDPDDVTIRIIDQRRLPHQMVIAGLSDVDGVIHAIRQMMVRGAPLIGVTAAWGMVLATLAAPAAASPEDCAAFLSGECARLKAARPTAVNLAWAAERVLNKALAHRTASARVAAARAEALAIEAEEVENGRSIGVHGLPLIEAARQQHPGRPVQILTHCNAGWLACVAHGTATAPIYAAHARGIALHVWVDETRPLNQGARLTAWELGQAGVPHTVICDNAGGHLMQHGQVDLVIVGSDRTTASGDVANKIGTYLKALAARDNGIPFYVALPSSTFDWTMSEGLRQIPIETRDPGEVHHLEGWDGERQRMLRLTPPGSAAANFAFDVTPARLVTALITERGLCPASSEGIRQLFMEKNKQPRC